MVGDSDECISAGQFAHKLVASTATATLNTTCCSTPSALKLVQHPDWNQASSWKQVLNNLRLVIQPSILNLLQPWLNLFPIPRLSAGLECLIALMNRFPSSLHATSHTQISTFFCLE